MFKAVVIAVLGLAALWAGTFVRTDAKSNDKPAEKHHGLLPETYAKGKLDELQKTLEAKPDYLHKLTRIEHSGNVYWLVELHLGDGVPHKQIAVYAPMTDGSHHLCLFAESWQAGSLKLKLDDKTGMVELSEAANSDLKGQVILAFNLRSIGSQDSTRK